MRKGSMRGTVRVLIISPRALVRAGLTALLRGQPQIDLVGEMEVAPSDTSLEFDIALWDVGTRRPQPMPFRFLVLLPSPADARAWLEAGTSGCVLETASVEELLGAMRQVARGDTFLSPPIVKQIVSSVAALQQPLELDVEPLTDRESEVLHLLALGLGNKDIAQKLYLSVRTVEGHLANIYGKLQVRSRTEAALWAVQRGLDKS